MYCPAQRALHASKIWSDSPVIKKRAAATPQHRSRSDMANDILLLFLSHLRIRKQPPCKERHRGAPFQRIRKAPFYHDFQDKKIYIYARFSPLRSAIIPGMLRAQEYLGPSATLSSDAKSREFCAPEMPTMCDILPLRVGYKKCHDFPASDKLNTAFPPGLSSSILQNSKLNAHRTVSFQSPNSCSTKLCEQTLKRELRLKLFRDIYLSILCISCDSYIFLPHYVSRRVGHIHKVRVYTNVTPHHSVIRFFFFRELPKRTNY